MLVKNRNFGQKLKFWSKIEICVKKDILVKKNEILVKKNKFWSKIQISAKHLNFGQKRNFGQKSKFSSNIEIWAKNKKISQSKFRSKHMS